MASSRPSAAPLGHPMRRLQTPTIPARLPCLGFHGWPCYIPDQADATTVNGHDGIELGSFWGVRPLVSRAAVLFTILAGERKRHRLEPWPYVRDVLLRPCRGWDGPGGLAAGPLGREPPRARAVSTASTRSRGKRRAAEGKPPLKQRSASLPRDRVELFRTTPARRSQATLAMSRATQCRRPQPNPEDGRPVRLPSCGA